ncbi:MAG: response regulator [Treponema sp.]|nr:response regulator [Treponema sp.]
MRKDDNSRYYKLTNVLIPLIIVFFGILRIINALLSEKIYEAVIGGALSAGVLIVLFLFRFLGRKINPAFIEPLLLYVFYFALSIATADFTYYFNVILVICAMAALYLDSRRLRYFLIVSNLITLVLMLLNIPMTNLTAMTASSENLIRWIILALGSIFIYLVTILAADKMARFVNAENYLSALLAATPNRVALLDPLNRVVALSNVFAEMVHVEDPKLAGGRPLLDLFRNMEVKDIFINIFKEEEHSEDIREIRLDGKTYYFRIITRKLPNKARGSHINMVDITPEMKARFEAEAASQSKSAFLATMSHEIRTPLNAILGLSEIELQKNLPDETYTALEKIYSSGSNLLNIINDILDISKIETGNFELVPDVYDIPSLINDAVQLNIVRIESKHINFELILNEEIPVKLYGDELRIKQILNNLLSNAFKYTDKGKVRLRIDWEWQQDDMWLIFTVSDTGHGIKKEDLGKLFSEYNQLDTRANRHIEGTGLGLAITKNLVDLMNGVITVESEYGRGSTFTVKIRQKIVDKTPIGQKTAQNLQQFRFVNKRLNRGRQLIRAYMPYGKVLIVDDVITNLDVMKGLLLPYGLTMDCVNSGEKAIEKIRDLKEHPEIPKYDLIFMDHMMPKMDGIEAVRIIRNEIDSEYARTVPIVALTANALTGNEEMFLTNGFNAYISKPIDLTQLNTALNTWVRNKQSEETQRLAEEEYATRVEEAEPVVPGLLDGLYVTGVDLRSGKERYNSETVYLEILRSFCIHTPKILDMIRNVSQETLAEYAVIVHGFKSSSYGICAGVVGKHAEILESAAKAGDLKTVQATNGIFLESAETLVSDLEKLLQKATANKGEKQHMNAPSSALLARLLDACRQYKPLLMEEIIVELEKYEYESGGELILWLREQSDNLEYDAIQERLKNEGL